MLYFVSMIWTLKNRFFFLLGLADYDPTKGRPHLTAWIERVTKKTSPHYQEVHKFLSDMVKEKMKKASFDFSI